MAGQRCREPGPIHPPSVCSIIDPRVAMAAGRTPRHEPVTSCVCVCTVPASWPATTGLASYLRPNWMLGSNPHVLQPLATPRRGILTSIGCLASCLIPQTQLMASSLPLLNACRSLCASSCSYWSGARQTTGAGGRAPSPNVHCVFPFTLLPLVFRS